MKRTLELLCLSLLLTAVWSASAFAAGAFAPFSMDSANVLPKGVRSIRVVSFTTEVTSRYDGSYSVVPLADKFNKPLKWNDFYKAQKGNERTQLGAFVKSQNQSLDTKIGDLQGYAATRVTATIPLIAYGITDRLTAAIAVPIFYSNLHVVDGWSPNGNFTNSLNYLATHGRLGKVLDTQPKIQDVVNYEAQTKGYKPLQDESATEMGDTIVALKYQLKKTEKFAWSLSPRVVIPTGRAPDPDKIVDVPPGTGAWDVGLGTTADYYLTGHLILSGSVGYLSQLPTTTTKRLPVSPDDTLSADRDTGVYQDLGDVASSSLGARYAFSSGWGLGGGFAAQYKQRDLYLGGRYDAERYSFLSDDTEQTLVAAQAAASYSTLPLFKAHRFPVPLEGVINYASVFAGRNVSKISLVSLEFAMFF
jgi:hypothetical protein